MLTRDQLSQEEWRAVRAAPHLVLLAVSAASGTPFDRMLERHAGMRGVTDALDSTHPLVRSLADAAEIVDAQDEIQRWIYRLADAERSAVGMQERALQAFSHALDVLVARGGGDDLMMYSDFVIRLANRVARAAREGDVLGVGGKRVSLAEAEFIRRLEVIAGSVVRA